MFKLNDNMKLGVASASMQVEGGELNSNWHDWADRGFVKDGSSPSNANDHWNRYEEDFKLMREMGITEYRFGIEWTRIEPTEGEFSDEALNHYRRMIECMRDNGIRPLMTLWHFSHPMWFENEGGWLKSENIPYFTRYVSVVLNSLGDLVEEYITINEPNVFAVNGYLFNEWPPSNNNGFVQCVKVMSVLATAHIEAYKLIKEYNNDYLVGFAHHVRVFKGVGAGLFRFLFQDGVALAFTKGEFKFPFVNYRRFKKGDYVDFLGVNYYSQTIVKGMEFGFSTDLPKNDLGWDIYPEGLVRCVRELYALCPKPIYITENGTCDNDDRFRSRYIYDHLNAINKVGLPILKYYYWSFSDNFEWVEGESSRFGLVHINYETMERTLKESGRFYASIIKNRGITRSTYDEFVAGSHYDSV